MPQLDIVSDGATSDAPLRTNTPDDWDTFGGAPVFARTLAEIRTYAPEPNIEANLYNAGLVENKFHNNALSNPNDANQIAWFDGFVWHLAQRLSVSNGFASRQVPDVGIVTRRIVLPPVILVPLLTQDASGHSDGEHCKRIIPPWNAVADTRNIHGVSVEFRISRSRSDRRTQIYAEANLSGARYNRDGSPRSMLYLGDHCLTLGRNTKVEELLGQVLLDLVDWIYAQNGRVDPTMERNDLLRIGKLISLSKAKDVAAAVKLGDFGSLVSCSLPPYGYPIGSLLDAHARLGALEARMLGISCC